MEKNSGKHQFLIVNFPILLIVGFVFVVMIFMMFNVRDTVTIKTKDLIETTKNEAESELDLFFKPVEKSLFIAQEWGETGMIKDLNPEGLNQIFVPLLKQYEQVSSVLVADENGNELLILESEENQIINRQVIFEDTGKQVWRYEWDCSGVNQELINKEVWTEKLEYDPRHRPWYKQAITADHDNYCIWTYPYVFATTKDLGITTSIRWQNPADSLVYIIAFDVLLKDISRYTASLTIGESGKAFVLTEDYHFVGLPNDPRFESMDSLNKYLLSTPEEAGIPEIAEAIKQYKNNPAEDIIKYHVGSEGWWCVIKSYPLCPKHTLLIGVMVPQKDFIHHMMKTRNIFIMGFIMLGLIVFMMFLNYYISQRSRNQIERLTKKLKNRN